MPKPVRLKSIRLHPVKSTAIRDVPTADIDPFGLVGDRRWMVVDSDGECITARTDRDLFAIVADTPQTVPNLPCELRLSAPGLPTLELAAPAGGGVDATVFGRPLPARAAGPDADSWVCRALARDDVRLVALASPETAAKKLGGARTFVDGCPVTLATTASLTRVNEWIQQTADERGEDGAAIPIDRFRPNLVVEGEVEPFAEDSWTCVTVGGVRLRVVKGIERCAMTLVDPHTLATGREPIRSLARHRKWEGSTWFGLQLLPEVAGALMVGDDVRADTG